MNAARQYGFDLIERKVIVENDAGRARTKFVEIVDIESMQITMHANDLAEAEIKVREFVVSMCDNALEYCEKIDAWLEDEQPKLDAEYQDVCKNLQNYLARLEKRGLKKDNDVIARHIEKVWQRVLRHASAGNES